MTRSVDLNADLGESFGAWTMGNDDAMLDVISTANVACGFHAGDPQIMAATVRAAKTRGVGVGAHPGFADLAGFGRRQIRGDSPAEIERLVAYQIGALQAIAALEGYAVSHVKAHGALSNMAMVEDELALAIGRAVKGVDPKLLFLVMPGTALARAGEALGLNCAFEVFADRAYEDDATLVSRKKPGAMIEDADFAARRVVAMVTDGAVTSITGKRVPIQVDTVCVHGDSPHAVAMARAVRQALDQAGIAIRPLHRR